MSCTKFPSLITFTYVYRRIRVCNWLLSRICCCCSGFQAPERQAGSMYSSTMTQYSSMVDDRTCSSGSIIRNPKSVSLRNKLTDKENEILMKNVHNEIATTKIWRKLDFLLNEHLHIEYFWPLVIIMWTKYKLLNMVNRDYLFTWNK